jgi:AcrR family transcriptional regulator
MRDLALSTKHWVNAPLQSRSEKTLEKILDAAERILVEEGIDALTVPHVVKESKTSTGSFYARFDGKMSLLSMLHTRACDQTIATAEATLDPALFAGQSTGQMIETFVAFAVKLFGARKSIMSAFARAFAGDEGFADRRTKTAIALGKHLTALLMTRRKDIHHPDPELAIGMALRIVTATLEQRMALGVRVSDDTLTEELGRIVLGYLGVK